MHSSTGRARSYLLTAKRTAEVTAGVCSDRGVQAAQLDELLSPSDSIMSTYPKAQLDHRVEKPNSLPVFVKTFLQNVQVSLQGREAAKAAWPLPFCLGHIMDHWMMLWTPSSSWNFKIFWTLSLPSLQINKPLSEQCFSFYFILFFFTTWDYLPHPFVYVFPQNNLTCMMTNFFFIFICFTKL